MTSRTWCRDSYLQKVADLTIVKKTSITKRIHHSDIYRARFQKNVNLQRYNPTATKYVKSLASANHRFDSHAKPFARCCVFFDALVMTAQQLQDERKGKAEGRDATNFLQELNPEFVLTLGLLADAGCENLALVRFFDDETFDKSKQSHEIPKFLNRIKWLFVDQGCLKVGYTALMLQHLQRARTIWVGSGVDAEARTLGGRGKITAENIKSALQRLVNWTVLAEAVLHAEFPGFDALSSFAVFNMDAKKLKDVTDNAQWDTHVHRLAQLCSVDADELSDQIRDHLPIAFRFAKQQCDTMASWRQAVEATQRVRTTAKAHPSAALSCALVRFAAYQGSTSGVERLFSKGHVTAGLCRTDLSEDLILDEVHIICDNEDHEAAKWAADAQKIWRDVYKTARGSGSGDGDRPRRIDFGVPKKAVYEDGKTSLANFERQRQALVEKMSLNRSPSSVVAAPVVGTDGWTVAHAGEIAFQKSKRLARFLEAGCEGRLLEKELTPKMRRALELYKIYQQKVADEYQVRKNKERREQAPPIAPLLDGKRAYVDTGVGIDNNKRELAKLRTAGMTRTLCREDAEVFVVHDVVHMGQRNTWCLALGGGIACDLEYMASAGSKGRCLTYSAAGRVRRDVFMSPGFLRTHPTLAQILIARTKHPSGKWVWHVDKASFRSVAATKHRQKRFAEVVAFLLDSEVASQDLHSS